MEIARFIKEEVKRQLKKCLEEAQSYFHTVSGPKLALVIDGKCLMYALDPTLRVMLLNLSLNCHAVVCCRVSPLQKAQVKLMHYVNNLLSSCCLLQFFLFIGIFDVPIFKIGVLEVTAL